METKSKIDSGLIVSVIGGGIKLNIEKLIKLTITKTKTETKTELKTKTKDKRQTQK